MRVIFFLAVEVEALHTFKEYKKEACVERFGQIESTIILSE